MLTTPKTAYAPRNDPNGYVRANGGWFRTKLHAKTLARGGKILRTESINGVECVVWKDRNGRLFAQSAIETDAARQSREIEEVIAAARLAAGL